MWEGITPATLGYAHITIAKPVADKELTIRMVAPVQSSSKFGQVKELAGGVANQLDRAKAEKGKTELRIVEADLLTPMSENATPTPRKTAKQPAKKHRRK